ncbi:hypothetical protein Tco_1438258 [Tanacetum coccineum]
MATIDRPLFEMGVLGTLWISSTGVLYLDLASLVSSFQMVVNSEISGARGEQLRARREAISEMYIWRTRYNVYKRGAYSISLSSMGCQREYFNALISRICKGYGVGIWAVRVNI